MEPASKFDSETEPELESYFRPSPDDSRPISHAYMACMDGFTSLMDVVQRAATDEAQSGTHKTDAIKIREEIVIQKTRLSNWMAAIDAFHHRQPLTLSDASHIQNQVLQLLQDLQEAIRDG